MLYLFIKSQIGATMLVNALAAVLNQFKFIKSQKGVTMVEYALIAALISIAAIAVIGVAGGHVQTIFTKISTELGTAAS